MSVWPVGVRPLPVPYTYTIRFPLSAILPVPYTYTFRFLWVRTGMGYTLTTHNANGPACVNRPGRECPTTTAT